MIVLTATNLHRVHAAPASGRGGASFDVGDRGGVRWRGEAATVGNDVKRAMAHRLALCWNVCEGWPTEAIEGGCLLAVDAAAFGLLKALYAQTELPDAVIAARDALKAAFDARDPQQDLTGGRLHDCPGCNAESTEPCP